MWESSFAARLQDSRSVSDTLTIWLGLPCVSLLVGAGQQLSLRRRLHGDVASALSFQLLLVNVGTECVYLCS